MRINRWTTFNLCVIHGQPALYQPNVIDQGSIKDLDESLYQYELKEDFNKNIISVEPVVHRGFAGSLITTEPLPLDYDDKLRIDGSNDLVFDEDAEPVTLDAWLKDLNMAPVIVQSM